MRPCQRWRLSRSVQCELTSGPLYCMASHCSDVDDSQCLWSDRRFMKGKLTQTRQSCLQELSSGETMKVRRVPFSWKPGKASGWDVGFCIHAYIYKGYFLNLRILFSVFRAHLRKFFITLSWLAILSSLFLSFAHFTVNMRRNKGVCVDSYPSFSQIILQTSMYIEKA